MCFSANENWDRLRRWDQLPEAGAKTGGGVNDVFLVKSKREGRPERGRERKRKLSLSFSVHTSLKIFKLSRAKGVIGRLGEISMLKSEI